MELLLDEAARTATVQDIARRLGAFQHEPAEKLLVMARNFEQQMFGVAKTVDDYRRRIEKRLIKVLKMIAATPPTETPAATEAPPLAAPVPAAPPPAAQQQQQHQQQQQQQQHPHPHQQQPEAKRYRVSPPGAAPHHAAVPQHHSVSPPNVFGQEQARAPPPNVFVQPAVAPPPDARRLAEQARQEALAVQRRNELGELRRLELQRKEQLEVEAERRAKHEQEQSLKRHAIRQQLLEKERQALLLERRQRLAQQQQPQPVTPAAPAAAPPLFGGAALGPAQAALFAAQRGILEWFAVRAPRTFCAKLHRLRAARPGADTVEWIDTTLQTVLDHATAARKLAQIIATGKGDVDSVPQWCDALRARRKDLEHHLQAMLLRYLPPTLRQADVHASDFAAGADRIADVLKRSPLQYCAKFSEHAARDGALESTLVAECPHDSFTAFLAMTRRKKRNAGDELDGLRIALLSSDEPFDSDVWPSSAHRFWRQATIRAQRAADAAVSAARGGEGPESAPAVVVARFFVAVSRQTTEEIPCYEC